MSDRQADLFTLGQLVQRIFDHEERGGRKSDTLMVWMGDHWSGYIDIDFTISAEEARALAGLDIEPFASGEADG